MTSLSMHGRRDLRPTRPATPPQAQHVAMLATVFELDCRHTAAQATMDWHWHSPWKSAMLRAYLQEHRHSGCILRHAVILRRGSRVELLQHLVLGRAVRQLRRHCRAQVLRETLRLRDKVERCRPVPWTAVTRLSERQPYETHASLCGVQQYPA